MPGNIPLKQKRGEFLTMLCWLCRWQRRRRRNIFLKTITVLATTSSNLNIYNILLTISSELLNIKTKLTNIICSKHKTSKMSFVFLLELKV